MSGTTQMPDDNRGKMERIRGFWDAQAERFAEDVAATTPDPLAKELELRTLKQFLRSGNSTLEAGCGNGYNLFNLADFLTGRLVGFDYADKMIGAAECVRALRPDGARFSFDVRSVLDDLSDLGAFDQVFTDRCLINLPSPDLQLQAVGNLAGRLRPGGALLLIESTQQGQDRINEMRRIVGLQPIAYHWHNLYLDEPAFLAGLPASVEHVGTENFASLYFVISRVFNARLTPEGQPPDYLAEINRIAAMLPSFGDCAPLKLFRLRRKP